MTDMVENNKQKLKRIRVRDYTTVNIPKQLVEKVRGILKKGGYLNLSDFVRDAVRMRLEELIEKPKEGE